MHVLAFLLTVVGVALSLVDGLLPRAVLVDHETQTRTHLRQLLRGAALALQLLEAGHRQHHVVDVLLLLLLLLRRVLAVVEDRLLAARQQPAHRQQPDENGATSLHTHVF